MSAITILKENVPQGPFTRAEVAEKLTRGEFTLESLAFVDGLSQWTPLRDVLARVDAAAPVQATMPVSIAAPSSPGTAYSYAATMQPPEHLVYAGFWLRAGAFLIDVIILLPLSIISIVLNVMMKSTSNDTAKGVFLLAIIGYALVCIVVRWLYFSLQESSAKQATIGKRVVGLRVTDRQGQRIGFGRATGRYFGKILSGIIFCIGYMMAGWTERKQALHDMLADTLVVRRPDA